MKKRFVIFIVLSVISVTFTIIFSLSVCGLAAVNADFADNVDEMIVDGTDFTPIMKTGAVLLDVFLNEMLPVLMYIVFFIVTILLNLALFGFYRLFGLHGELLINNEEFRLTRKFFIISAAAAAVLSAIISVCSVVFGNSSTFCFFNLLLCWQYPLFAWLFCLCKLKKVCPQQKVHKEF